MVGERGVIFTSRDGMNWGQLSSPKGSDLNAVTLKQNILLAVGANGTVLLNKLSDKGFVNKWFNLTSRLRMYAIDLVCFKDLFVLLEPMGIYTTPSAAKWERVYESYRNDMLSHLIATDDKLIVIGENGQILYTENMIDWVEVDSGTTKDLLGICWNNDRFVIVGADENAGVVLTSTDGIVWSIVQDNLVGDLFTGITWNGKQYIAVGKNLLKSSTDAVTWIDLTNSSILQEQLAVPNMTTITNCVQNFIIAGHIYETGLDKPTGFVKLLTNHTLWAGVGYQPDSGNFLYQNYDFVQGDDFILLIGKEGAIFSSRDRETWTLEESGSIDLFAGCWNETQFVVVGDQGTVQTSPNGKDWTPRNSGVIESLRDVAWNGSYYLAVGDNGVIITSTDGIVWTSKTSGVTTHLEAAVWNGTKWVVVGGKYPYEGALIYSSDALTWTKSTTKTLWLSLIIWNGKQFLATGLDGRVFISSDGVQWQAHVTSFSAFSDLIWDGRRYLALCKTDVITSENGIDWILA